jgi:sec-independent protein translocase protein TatB
VPGFQEIVVILLIVALVVGPNRLPTVTRDVTKFLLRARGEMRTMLDDLKGDMDSSGMGDDLRELKRELDETRRMASQAMRGEPEAKPRPTRTRREDGAGGDGAPADDAQAVDSAMSGDSGSEDPATSDPATGDATRDGVSAEAAPTPGPSVNGATHGPAPTEDPSTPHASTNGTPQRDAHTNEGAPSVQPVAVSPVTGLDDAAPRDPTDPPSGEAR